MLRSLSILALASMLCATARGAEEVYRLEGADTAAPKGPVRVEKVPWSLQEDGHWFLRLGVAPTAESYRLSGGGFNADLPNRSGLLFLGELRYVGPFGLVEASLSFDQTAVTFAVPSSLLTPEEISFRRRRAFAMGWVRPFRGLENGRLRGVALGVGYGWQGTESTVTNPTAVLLPQTQLGVLVGAKQEFLIAPELAIEWTGIVFLPHSFSERHGSTGAHSNAMHFSANAALVSEITRNFSIAGGLGFRIERQSYRGTGTRAVTDASESYTSWSLPLEARWSF